MGGISTKVKGIVAGAFDIIHPGYIRMFKNDGICNHLTIALHDDPSKKDLINLLQFKL